jgi:hypothetical protein
VVVVGDPLQFLHHLHPLHQAEADRPEHAEMAAGAMVCVPTILAALRMAGVERPAPIALVVLVQLVEVERLLQPERVETAAVAMECVPTTHAALYLGGVERPPRTALVVPRLLLQLALVGVAIAGMAVVPIRTCAAPSMDGVEHPPPIAAVGAIFATPTRLW